MISVREIHEKHWQRREHYGLFNLTLYCINLQRLFLLAVSSYLTRVKDRDYDSQIRNWWHCLKKNWFKKGIKHVWNSFFASRTSGVVARSCCIWLHDLVHNFANWCKLLHAERLLWKCKLLKNTTAVHTLPNNSIGAICLRMRDNYKNKMAEIK